MSKENQTPENNEENYEGILGDYQETAEAENASEAANQETQNDGTEEPKKKFSKKALAIAGISVASAAVVGCLAFVGYRHLNPGKMDANLVAETEHYKIDRKVLACYYKDVISMFISYYGEEALSSYYGMDVSQPMKDQVYPYDESQTWYDVVMDQAKNTLTQQLVICEAALEADFEMPDENKEEIEKRIAEADLASYENGVEEADLRKALEIQAYSTAYYQYYMDNLNLGDEEIEAFFEENKLQFTTCGLAGFSISYDPEATDDDTDSDAEDSETEAETAEETSAEEDDASSEEDGETSDTEAETEEETKPMTMQKAKELADGVSACKNAEEFESKVREILVGYEGYTEDEMDTILPTIYNNTYPYTEGSELAEWAFNEANLYDIKLIESEGLYRIYMLTSEPTRDESETIDVRHILFMEQEDNKKAAEDALAEWKAGPATEESFAELAEKYSEDPGSNTNGGLYEGVTPGEMVASFNDWCFDASRKTGDTGIVETDYGYHVMYFSGKGNPAWKASVLTSLEDVKYQEWYEEQLAKHAITFNDEIVNTIVG